MKDTLKGIKILAPFAGLAGSSSATVLANFLTDEDIDEMYGVKKEAERGSGGRSLGQTSGGGHSMSGGFGTKDEEETEKG